MYVRRMVMSNDSPCTSGSRQTGIVARAVTVGRARVGSATLGGTRRRERTRVQTYSVSIRLRDERVVAFDGRS